MQRVLVTGRAGFTGYHLSALLLSERFTVQGLDVMTDYHDVRLKRPRGGSPVDASTSSVYGANTDMPYAETHKADLQMTIYAASKQATESMCPPPGPIPACSRP